MSEKKTKKLFFKHLLIVIYTTIISSVIVLLLLWFVVPLFVTYSEPALSPSLNILKQKLENDPANIALQKEFIHTVIQEQENIDDSSKKSEILLTYAIEVAEQYVNKQSDMDIRLALARLYFQSGSVTKAKGSMLKAALMVNKGIEIFDVLMEQHASTIFVRLFRARNFASIPRFFGKGDIAISDFKYLAVTILSDNFDIVKTIPNVYYQRALLHALKFAIPYVKKHVSQDEQSDLPTLIDAAYQKIKKIIEQNGDN